MSVLKLTVHLDEDGLAAGGGWAYENPAGTVVSMMAWPGWSNPMPVDTAAEFLVATWNEACGHQLAF